MAKNNTHICPPNKKKKLNKKHVDLWTNVENSISSTLNKKNKHRDHKEHFRNILTGQLKLRGHNEEIKSLGMTRRD